MEKVYDLNPKYDSANSFYGKAKVMMHTNNKGELIHSLYSYNTLVAYINIDRGHVRVSGTYSKTTLRHIKEFLRQHGKRAESKKDVERFIR